jgi:hypothetical protein
MPVPVEIAETGLHAGDSQIVVVCRAITFLRTVLPSEKVHI